MSVDQADPVTIAIARLRRSFELSDPVKWARERLGIDLYSQQRWICEDVKSHSRVAVRSSHEIGKTLTAAVLALWWIDTHPAGTAFVITTAPSGPQLKSVLWREINRMFDRARQREPQNPLPGRMLQTEWWIGNEQVGLGRKPADWDTDAFQGIHAEYVLAIIDEANGVPKAMWTGVEGVTSNDTSKVLAIGNPDDPESEFARVSEEGNRVWFKRRISAFDTPAFTGEQVHPRVLRALVGRHWVESRRLDWGEDSPLYTSRVLGEFPEIGSQRQKVVPITAVLACLEEPDMEDPTIRRLPTKPVELGMDVAAGGDETVLRERRGAYAGRSYSARTPEPEDAVELAIEAIVDTGATMLKVDEIGYGWGIAAAIRARLRELKITSCRVAGINVAQRSTQPDKYYNLRTELWWMARDLSKDGGWILHGMDNAQATIAQLTDPNWYTRAGGKTQVEEKAETIKRLGRSPDDADALILAFAKPTRFGGPAKVSRPTAPVVRSSSAAQTPTRRRPRAQGARRASTLVARRG